MTRQRREAAIAEQERLTLKKGMVLLRAKTAPVEIVVFLAGACAVAEAIHTGEES